MASPVRSAVRMLALYTHLYRKALHEGDFESAKEYLEGMRFWSRRVKELAELCRGLEEVRELLRQK